MIYVQLKVHITAGVTQPTLRNACSFRPPVIQTHRGPKHPELAAIYSGRPPQRRSNWTRPFFIQANSAFGIDWPRTEPQIPPGAAQIGQSVLSLSKTAVLVWGEKTAGFSLSRVPGRGEEGPGHTLQVSQLLLRSQSCFFSSFFCTDTI